MKTEKEIFGQIGKDRFSVPEGYFESLKDRLGAIPEGRSVIEPGLWMRVRPYTALAACFIFAFVVGTSLLQKTSVQESLADKYYKEIVYADMIPLTDPNAIFYGTDEIETLSEEDIINYLIESGVPTEQIAYAYLQE